jgi:hypothetical protein
LAEADDQVFKDTGIAPEYDAVDVDANEVAAIASRAEKPTTEQTRKMTDAVKQLGLMTGTGKTRANAVGSLVDAIRNREISGTPYIRTFSEMLGKSGVDLTKIDLKFVNHPNKRYAAHYLPNAADVSRGTITLNLAVAHEGGIITSVMHEVVHHTTLVKLDPSYKRTAVEQKAMDNLQKLYDHASAKAYENIFGKEGTPEEISAWQQAQSTKNAKLRRADAPERAYDRSLYQFSGLHEFVTEAITNPKAAFVLENIEGLPGLKGSTKGKTLLEQIYQHIKDFIANLDITKGSVLDQSLDHILAIGTTAAKQSRARGTIWAATDTKSKATEDLSKLSRDDLEDRVRAIDPSADPYMMTTAEMKEMIQPTKGVAKGGPSHGLGVGPGWVAPDGSFISAGESSAMT